MGRWVLNLLGRSSLALSAEVANERLGSAHGDGSIFSPTAWAGTHHMDSPSSHQLESLFQPHGRGSGVELMQLHIPQETSVHGVA